MRSQFPETFTPRQRAWLNKICVAMPELQKVGLSDREEQKRRNELQSQADRLLKEDHWRKVNRQ